MISPIEADRQHPTKRLRPFASGELKVRHALIAAPLMIAAALPARCAVAAIRGGTAAICC